MIRPRNRVLPVPGLQALWLALENVAGGASWLDRSGNGYHAALTAPFAVTGGEGLTCSVGAGMAVIGNVLNFERTDSFSFVIGTTCMSFSATGRFLLSKMRNGSGYAGTSFWIGNFGVLGCDLRNLYPTNQLEVTRNAVLTAGTRYVLGWAYNGSSLASGALLYVDGDTAAQTTNYNSLSASILTTIPLQLGGLDGMGYQYVGQIHWAGIWNRVITPAEMSRINRVFNL